jgi:hypothetical protein
MILVFSFRDFQIKKYPKISCGAGILPANNIRTGPDAHPTRLDSEALLQAVHLFYGVLLDVTGTKYKFKCKDVPWNVFTRILRSLKIIFIPQISNIRI